MSVATSKAKKPLPDDLSGALDKAVAEAAKQGSEAAKEGSVEAPRTRKRKAPSKTLKVMKAMKKSAVRKKAAKK